MTYAQLEMVAMRRGLVRWTRSGIVEMLRICKHRKNHSPSAMRLVHILAVNLLTNKEHRIFKHDNDYECVALSRKECIRLGDLEKK